MLFFIITKKRNLTETIMLFQVVAVVVAMATVASANITPLTQADKNLIVADHNNFRAKQHTIDMETMSWDESLAQQAQTWTNKCVFAHQHNQPWGENIAAEAGDYDNTQAINQMFNLWIGEEKFNTDGSFHCCSDQGQSCCHLTQVEWAKTNKVGCGLSVCPALKNQAGGTMMQNAVYMACYYEPRGNAFVYKCGPSGCTLSYKPFQTA